MTHPAITTLLFTANNADLVQATINKSGFIVTCLSVKCKHDFCKKALTDFDETCVAAATVRVDDNGRWFNCNANCDSALAKATR